MGDDGQQQETTTAAGGRSAYDDAVGRLGRRPYTVAELRDWLLERGHDPLAVAEAVERCSAQRWLDDAALSHAFIVARAARIGYGPDRLVVELKRRGVDAAIARDAWCEALDEGSVDLAAMLDRRVRRRLAGRRRLTRTALARVYTALLREGFERDAVERVLRLHASSVTTAGLSGGPDVDDGPGLDGQDDDFA